MFIYLLLVVGSAAAILLVSHRVGRRPLTAEKDVPYECGMLPIEKAHTQFPVRFYKVALLFVVFDVEIVFCTSGPSSSGISESSDSSKCLCSSPSCWRPLSMSGGKETCSGTRTVR